MMNNVSIINQPCGFAERRKGKEEEDKNTLITLVSLDLILLSLR